MEERKSLPIGNDDFAERRTDNCYYVDKSLLIKDFLDMNDKVALVARPRRFGKTLNMTMLREFFDIIKDSREIFEGLAIMDTEYADQIDRDSFESRDFYEMIDVLRATGANQAQCSFAIQLLTQFVKNGYGIAPILLIDEYDQPIMSSYEYGYHDQLGPFFPISMGAP